MANVEIKVKSGLATILEDLEKLRVKAEEVQESLKDTGEETEKSIKKNTKETETFFGNLKNFGRRVSDQLKKDFKALASVESLGAGLKISSQFKDSIAETVRLSDTIRKLGPVFGMAERDFVGFQKTLTDGLGEIGLSSDVASKTLEGLSQTQVRGPENLTAYSRTAGQLASISRETGREDAIAKGMAKVIQARGGDVNDKKQMEELAESLRRVFITTGQGPTKTLQDMEDIFSRMPQDFRKMFGPQALGSLSTASAVGGPGATKFLEEFLGESDIARKKFEAQGAKGIFDEKGLNIDKFRTFAKDIMGRIGGDPRMAAETLGLTKEAAEGFVRLAESLDRVEEAEARRNKTAGNLNQTYRQSMGLGESFRANINRIKAVISEPLATATQTATGFLGKASESDLGAAGVVAGGGLLAALLTGGGLRGLGKSVLGTAARGAAAEQITGQKTIPVYVTNAAEIGMGGLAAAGGGGGMGMAGKVLGVLGAAGAGVAIGQAIEPAVSQFLTEKTTGTTEEGFKGDVIERLFFKLDMLLGGDTTASYRMAPPQKVKVDFNTPMLKEVKQPNKAASN